MADHKKLRYNRVVAYLAVVMALIAVFFSLTTSTFATWRNLFDLVESYAVTGIFAMGLLVVLVTGGIAISFLATASVVQYLTVKACLAPGADNIALVGIVTALVIGVAIGTLNGLLIFKLNIVSLIVPIRLQSILFGFLMYASGGRSIYSLPDWMYTYGGSALTLTIGGDRIPVSLAPFIMVVISILTWILLNRTTVGRQLYPMGGNA